MVKKQKQSKWGEVGDDVIKLVANNWWKVILIILAAGFAVTGFSLTFGQLQCKKDAVIKNKSFKKPLERRDEGPR
jgi:hypothetical protein